MERIGSDVLDYIISFVGCRHHLQSTRQVNHLLKSTCEKCQWICCLQVTTTSQMQYAYKNRHRIVTLIWDIDRHITFDLPHLRHLTSSFQTDIRIYGRLPQLEFIDCDITSYSPEESPALKNKMKTKMNTTKKYYCVAKPTMIKPDNMDFDTFYINIMTLLDSIHPNLSFKNTR
jgi:hypothetical protein